MRAYVDTLNAWSTSWWQWIGPASWQSAAVAGGLLLLIGVGRRWTAPLRHGLLVIALLKFAVPPNFWAPTGVLAVAAAPISSLGKMARATDMVRPVPKPAWSDGNPALILPADPTTPPAERATFVLEANRNPSVYLETGYTWRTWLMLLHALGMGLAGAWIVHQHRQVRRMTEGACRVTRGELHEQLAAAAKRIGITNLPQLLVSTDARSPSAFGVVAPTIILPAVALPRWSGSDLRTILAHELAHFRRRDLLINALQMGLSVIWWFHPFFWAVSRSIRKVREDCCDDLLLTRELTSSDAYCDVLLHAARDLTLPVLRPAALGFGEGIHPLERRLARIMDDGLTRSARLSVSGLFIVIAAGCLFLPGVRGEPGVTPLSTNAAASRAGPDASHRRERIPITASHKQARAAKDKAELPGLIAQLDSSDPGVVFAATRSLEEFGAEAQAAVPALLDSIACGNEPGVVALVRIAPTSSEVAAGLVKILGDARQPVNVRTAIARWIGELKGQSELLEPALVSAFNGADARLQRKIAWSLQALGASSAAAKSALAQAGRGPDPWETEFGGCSVEQLIEYIREPRMRYEDINAAQFLTKFGPAGVKAVPALIEMLNDRSRLSRGVVVQALAEIGPGAAAAVPALVAYLKGGERPHSHVVPYALSRICAAQKHPAAITALIEAIDDARLQNMAVTVLGEFGPAAQAAVPRLWRLFHSDQMEEQVRAARALSRIDRDRAPELVPFWIKMLQTQAGHAPDAVEALGLIGHPAAPAISLLNTIATNPQQPAHLREQASKSLALIRTQSGLF